MAKRYQLQVKVDETTKERLRILAGDIGMSEYVRRLVDHEWDRIYKPPTVIYVDAERLVIKGKPNDTTGSA